MDAFILTSTAPHVALCSSVSDVCSSFMQCNIKKLIQRNCGQYVTHTHTHRAGVQAVRTDVGTRGFCRQPYGRTTSSHVWIPALFVCVWECLRLLLRVPQRAELDRDTSSPLHLSELPDKITSLVLSLLQQQSSVQFFISCSAAASEGRPWSYLRCRRSSQERRVTDGAPTVLAATTPHKDNSGYWGGKSHIRGAVRSQGSFRAHCHCDAVDVTSNSSFFTTVQSCEPQWKVGSLRGETSPLIIWSTSCTHSTPLTPSLSLFLPLSPLSQPGTRGMRGLQLASDIWFQLRDSVWESFASGRRCTSNTNLHQQKYAQQGQKTNKKPPHECLLHQESTFWVSLSLNMKLFVLLWIFLLFLRRWFNKFALASRKTKSTEGKHWVRLECRTWTALLWQAVTPDAWPPVTTLHKIKEGKKCRSHGGQRATTHTFK